jgi:hypothetical protein
VGFLKIELAAGKVISDALTKPARLTTWFSAFEAFVVSFRNCSPPRSGSCQPRAPPKVLSGPGWSTFSWPGCWSPVPAVTGLVTVSRDLPSDLQPVQDPRGAKATMRVWNGLHFSRSSRAGMVDRSGTGWATVMMTPLAPHADRIERDSSELAGRDDRNCGLDQCQVRHGLPVSARSGVTGRSATVSSSGSARRASRWAGRRGRVAKRGEESSTRRRSRPA